MNTPSNSKKYSNLIRDEKNNKANNASGESTNFSKHLLKTNNVTGSPRQQQ